MKLSDIKGERALDVVADIIDPIASIAEDKQAAGLFEPRPLPEGMTPTEFFISRVRESLPQLIRSHKAELVTIMASVNGVTTDEYLESLTLAKLFSDVVELMTDTEFASFFA